MSKFIREKRLREFKNDWLDKLAWKVEVSNNKDQFEYIFESEKYGVVSFFPKSDKIHFHKENSWIGYGLYWLIKNLKLNDD